MTPATDADRVALVALGLGLTESEDDLRATLIQNGADQPTVGELAAAVVVTLMERSRFQRTVTATVARHLFALVRAQDPLAANVVVMDGTAVFCPAPDGQQGVFYRIPSMQQVEADKVPKPIVATVFALDQAFLACQEIIG